MIRALCTVDAQCSYPEGELTGSIESSPDALDWETMHGMQHSDSTFNLISYPDERISKRYGYDVTAYAVLKVAAPLSESVLTLYTKKCNQSFQERARYRFS